MQKTNPIIIIPARLAATRFPNKPLADVNGLPMVVRIMKQAQESNIAEVLVAAGDKEIYDCVKDYGGEAILTAPELQSGTDRVAAAIAAYDPHEKYNVVVNLQGDLAVFDNTVLEACINGLTLGFTNPYNGTHQGYDISTVCTLIKDPRLINDKNTVKAIIAFSNDTINSAKYGTALYFTRGTAPYGEGDLYQHLGVYGYTRAALKKFVSLPSSLLEKRENLEQLRGLEAGLKIVVTVVTSAPMEVNTPEDLTTILTTLRG